MAAVGFDWIFFAIVAPWPIIALWIALTSRPPTSGDRVEQTIKVGRGINK